MKDDFSCKKVAFANEDAAMLYIAKLKRTSVRPVVPQRAYLCEACNRWHLTHIQAVDGLKIQSENRHMKKIIEKLNKRIEQQEKTIQDQRNEIIRLRWNKKYKRDVV